MSTNTKEQFTLASWYPSEAVKRRLGRICQEVNRQGATVHLLGTAEQPLLVLADANAHPATPGEIVLTIDEAKADWSAVTTAAAVYDSHFRLKGKKVMRAVLYRERGARHPAERYLRSSSTDAERLAQQLEALAKEVRKLGQIPTNAAAEPTDRAEATDGPDHPERSNAQLPGDGM